MKLIAKIKKETIPIGNLIMWILLLGILIQNCSPDSLNENINPKIVDNQITNESERLNWKEQLEKIINSPPDILVKNGIELLDFEIISSSIDLSVDENYYKNAIKTNENMIPLYSDDFKTFEVITKQEMALRSSQSQNFTIEKGDIYLDNLNLKGAKILNLRWNNNGVETNTICAVSEEEGIIYDNFITNFLVIRKPVIVKVQDENNDTTITNLTPRLKSGFENPNFSGCIHWTLTATADWIWGFERGEVKIDHDGHYSNGRFLYHNFSATHYFVKGNSEAKVSAISSNTIAYGYGLSTPYITISITFSGSWYSVSFSGILGSKCGGEGYHTHS